MLVRFLGSSEGRRFALPKQINSLPGLESVCEDREVLLASGVPLPGRDGRLVVFAALDHFSLVMH